MLYDYTAFLITGIRRFGRYGSLADLFGSYLKGLKIHHELEDIKRCARLTFHYTKRQTSDFLAVWRETPAVNWRQIILVNGG